LQADLTLKFIEILTLLGVRNVEWEIDFELSLNSTIGGTQNTQTLKYPQKV